MKVSKLIKQLKTLKDFCGDVNVRVYSNDYYMDTNKIMSAVYNNDKGRIEIYVTK